MTNATKTLGLIFIASLLVLGLNFAFSNSGTSEVFRGRLVDVDTSRVSKVMIELPTDGSAISLTRNEQGWSVDSAGVSYEADSRKVSRALDQIRQMEIQSLVTRNPDKYTRYKVDSTGTLLSLFDDENSKIEDMYVGSSGNTYVRIAGEDEVFAVNVFNGSAVRPEVGYWRDKTIWDVSTDAITEVRFRYPADSSFTIRKENESWLSLTDSLNQSKTSSLLSRLADLTAEEFTGDEGPVNTPLYTIEFTLDNGEVKTLDLKPQEGDSTGTGTYYTAGAAGYPYLFTLRRSTWDRTVLLRREELLKN